MEDIIISFDDKTGVKRTEAQMTKLIFELREVANNHGFDYAMSGKPESIYKALKMRFKK